MPKKQEGNKSLNRLALRAGLFYVISQLFVRGITFLTTPVFTRLLSNEQYNQVQIFESWLLLFAPVMSLCLWRSVERAKSIAVEDAGQALSEVTFTKTKLERDDGRTVYEIEFFAGDTEYEYTIDAASGAILERSAERED